MPSNVQALAQMADHAATQITASHESWTDFLRTAARLYKYPYHEQLMIYAQRPDATACAGYEIWNEKMRRYVRRGSRGIALIDASGDRPSIRYVFDVSDTGSRDDSRRPYLWKYRPEHEDTVTAVLEREYEVSGEKGLADQLEQIAGQLANEYWQEHQYDILHIVDGSFLEEYDEFNIGAQFRSAAAVSITYAVLSRCGLEPDKYFDHEDFLSIFDFNTPNTIDAALAQKPADFDALLKLLQEAGYEVKSGKVPALRGKDQKRFIRLDTLGSGYSEAELRAVLSGEKAHWPRKKIVRPVPDKKINLLVDIQAKLRAGKGVGYERWAKVFNLKQMAQTVNYLTEHNLLEYDMLAAKTASSTAQYNELSAQIKAAEKRLAEIAVLKTQIINYAKTRDTYVAYRKAGYSKKFLAEHESDILLHKAAKKSFDELGVKKLPTVKSLQAEYAALLAEKKAAYADYRKARNEMKELLTVKANVDHLLGTDRREVEREKDHGQR